MFFLRHKKGAGAFYLLEENVYTIGRKQCDILIENDNSISRHHATIALKNGIVVITDMKAKYKTFINSEELEQQGCRTLQISDMIHFGKLGSVYTLEEIKIRTVCSGLNSEDKKQLAECIEFLHGNLCLDWSTECTYLTVCEIVLTLKVLCALIQGQHIVTLKYWEDFVKNVTRNLPPPDVEDYKPLSAESILNQNLSFKYDSRRKTLFINKIFVFSTIKEKIRMQELIKLAGGQCISWNEQSLKPADFQRTEPEYIVIQEQTQVKASDEYNNIANYLSQNGKRLIPQQEIAIAVVLCSCEQNCNPNFNRGKALIQPKTYLWDTQDVLVPPTPSQSQSQSYFSADEKKVVIPQTAEEISTGIPGKDFVTSTQIEEEFAIKKQVIFEESSIKREGETLESSVPKRSKIEEEHPFGQRKENKNKHQQQVSLDISCIQSAQTERNIKFITDITAADVLNLRKRSYEAKATNQNQLPSRKSLVENPFGKRRKRENTVTSSLISNTVKDRNGVGENMQSSTSNSSTMQIIVLDQTPISDIVVVDPQLEQTFPWKSKSNITTRTYIAQENNENLDASDAMLQYINSFRDCILVRTRPMVVREPLRNLHNNNNDTGIKNFKKFKKVQPLYPQTNIIPNSAYQIIRCGEDSVPV